MKKLLILFTAFLLVGCTTEEQPEAEVDTDSGLVDGVEENKDDSEEDKTVVEQITDAIEEVSDIIKIQNANKDITEMHMDYVFETQVKSDPNETSGIEMDFDLGMAISMDVSNGVTHTTTSLEFFGMTIEIEMYSRIEDGQEVTYTNAFDVWTREVVMEENTSPTSFNLVDFTAIFEEDTLEIIEPIEINGRELKQMRLTMTGEQMKDNVGMDFAAEEATPEDIASQMEQEVSFIIAYSTESYLIERIEIDIQDLLSDVPEGVEFDSASLVLEISNHNAIGEIIIPEEALQAAVMGE